MNLSPFKKLKSLRWEKPNHGWLKCKVDIAFHISEGISTTGCCFRNAEGVFVAGHSTRKSTHISVLEGEAIALQEAIQVAIAKGWDKVVFETDSHTLVDRISDRSSGISEFNVIVSSIKPMLTLLSNFEVKFVRRQANMAAHSIARAACSLPSRHVFEICPPCIESFLVNDIS
jgi:ribonuclease HI